MKKVSIKTATMLKQLGYNEPCKTKIRLFSNGAKETTTNYYKKSRCNHLHNFLAMPYLIDVSDWLRENHFINIDVSSVGYNKEDNHFSYRCIVKSIHKHGTDLISDCLSNVVGDFYIFRNHNKALEQGVIDSLKYLLKYR